MSKSPSEMTLAEFVEFISSSKIPWYQRLMMDGLENTTMPLREQSHLNYEVVTFAFSQVVLQTVELVVDGRMIRKPIEVFLPPRKGEHFTTLQFVVEATSGQA